MTDLPRTRMTALEFFQRPERSLPAQLIDGAVIEMNRART